MKILRLSIFILLGLIDQTLIAQAPDWLWARAAEGSAYTNTCRAVCADTHGNVYVTGYFQSAYIVFGHDTLVNNPQRNSIFLVKYNSSGDVVWAENSLGNGIQRTYAISVDPNDNIIIAGKCDTSPMIFGGITMSGFDIFIAKFDSTGHALWARGAASPLHILSYNFSTAFSMTTDSHGNAYMTGNFGGDSATFDHIVLSSPSSGSGNIFTAKYDPAGNVVWAHSAIPVGMGNNVASDSANFSYSISVDRQGQSYIGGYFKGRLAFGSDTLESRGGADIFLAKYDSSGALVWTKDIGTTSDEVSQGLCTDSIGNVILGGYFRGYNISFDTTVLTNADSGVDKIYVAQYDPSGHLLWATSPGGNGQDGTTCLTTDSYGDIYMTGYFSQDTLIFDTTRVVRPGIGNQSAVIAKYDPSGHPLWAKSIGAANQSVGYSLSADREGNLYMAGGFNSDTLIFTRDTLFNPSRSTNIFIAKLFDTTHRAPVATGVSLYSYSPISIHPNPSTGTFYFTGLNPGSTIDIYDLLGQHVYSTISEKEITIADLSAHRAGVYLYRVTDGSSSQQGKIIRE